MSVVDLPKLYTEAEVAQYLGVDEQTVYRERKRGKLKSTKVGKKIRFTTKHIQDYLKSQEPSTRPRKLRKSRLTKK